MPRAPPALELQALDAAASHDRFGIVKLLLEAGVSIDGIPLPGQPRCALTPFFQSAASLGLRTTELLLQWRAAVDEQSSVHNQSALFGALTSLQSQQRHGVIEVSNAHKEKTLATIRLLLSFGADPTLAADENETALSLATSSGHVELVKLLLDSGAHKILEEAPSYNNHTPLIIASSFAYDNTVRLLLERGANVHARSSIDGSDALGYAVKAHDRVTNHWDVSTTTHTVSTLIDHGADLNGQNQLTPPLSQAVYWGNLPAIKLLLKAGANVDQVDHEGHTPLENCLAHRTGYRSMTAELITAGRFDKHSIEIFEVLLLNGADTNRLGPDGRTRLHDLCAYGGLLYGIRTPIVRNLLRYGALVDPLSSDGSHPFNYPFVGT